MKNPEDYDIMPKNWFERNFFCTHAWESVGNLNIFERSWDRFPTQRYKRWICTRCGSIKRQSII